MVTSVLDLVVFSAWTHLGSIQKIQSFEEEKIAQTFHYSSTTILLRKNVMYYTFHFLKASLETR